MTDPVRSLVLVRVTVEVEIDGVNKAKYVSTVSTMPEITDIPKGIQNSYRIAAESNGRTIKAAFGGREE